MARVPTPRHPLYGLNDPEDGLFTQLRIEGERKGAPTDTLRLGKHPFSKTESPAVIGQEMDGPVVHGHSDALPLEFFCKCIPKERVHP